MQTILVTGGEGFLGCRVAKFYGANYNVVSLSHADLDIANSDAVLLKITDIHPDYVVHCAAISNPSFAESHPELAWRVNVEGSVNIANACRSVGAKLVFMSSDQVYNGTQHRGLLSEDETLQPVDVYGKYKLEMERQIFALLPSAVGLRLTWMYDKSDAENVNIYTLVLEAFAKQKPMSVPVNEYRGFTDVNSVVRNIEKCFVISGGAYNFGSENYDSCYDSFLRVAREMELPNPEKLILPDSGAPFRNIAMDMRKINSQNIYF